MTVTDSVLLPRGTDMKCPALDELQSVGSDLRPQYEADKAWILRTRVYTLWKNGNPVKWARHAFHISDESFLGWVQECVRKGSPIPLTARKTHLVSLKEAIEKGKVLGQQEVRKSHPKLDWDQKRVETTKLNPFAEWAPFPPQPTIPETMRKRGRPRKK